MKWLVAQPGPAFSVHDVYAGWVEALEGLGQRVVPFNLDERLTFYDAAWIRTGEASFRKAFADSEQAVELAVNGLYAALYKTRPDVLLVVSGFLVPAELLDLARAYGTRVVLLHTECPYEDDAQVERAAHADLNLLNDPTNIDRFTAVAPAEYMPHAYRPAVHYPGPGLPELKCDLGFVGTGFQSRIDLFEAMDFDGLDVLLGGNWRELTDDSPLWRFVGHERKECLDNERGADVYRSARAGINLYRREADRPELSAGWAMGPREVEMAACGLPFLRDPRPEGDEVFPWLPTFTSPGEADERLRWLLAREDVRDDLGRRSREAVADRTFTNHAARLLRRLEKE